MKTKPIILAALMLTGTGCVTRFSVTQTDESPNERKITSQITATSILSSAQTVAGIKAFQGEKSQSFGSPATLNQQGGTNVVEVLDALLKLIPLIK